MNNLVSLNNNIFHHIVICDKQNGFRAGRSTADHLSALFFIVETKIKKEMNTFATFLIFQRHITELIGHCYGINCHILELMGKCLMH